MKLTDLNEVNRLSMERQNCHRVLAALKTNGRKTFCVTVQTTEPGVGGSMQVGDEFSTDIFGVVTERLNAIENQLQDLGVLADIKVF